MQRTALLTCLPALLATLSAVQAEEAAALRFAHVSADSPLVDVVLADEALFRDVGRAEVTAYAAIPAGEHELRIFPHRPPRAQSGEEHEGVRAGPLEPLSVRIDAVDGAYYTLVLQGYFEPEPEGGDAFWPPVDLELYRDWLEAFPQAGQAALRIVQAAPVEPAWTIELAGSTEIARRLAFGEASDYIHFDAKTYNLVMKPADSEDEAVTLEGVIFEPGVIYTLFLTTQNADERLEVLAGIDAMVIRAAEPADNSR